MARRVTSGAEWEVRRLFLPGGFTVFIKRKYVPASPGRPQAFKYNLTLLDHLQNLCILYDNAHAIKGAQGFTLVTFDHYHQFKTGERIPYCFTDWDQLIADFFRDVEAYLAGALED